MGGRREAAVSAPTDPALRHAAATQRARKARDAGVILPVFGAVALTPPVAWIFSIDTQLFGIPLVVLYVFVVWAVLILGARGIARRIEADTGETRPFGPAGAAPGPADSTGRTQAG